MKTIRWGIYPFARPTLALIIGIGFYEALLQPFSNPTDALLIALVAVGLLGVGLLRGLPAAHPWTKTAYSTAFLVGLALFGALRTSLVTATNEATHLLHQPAGLRAWQGVVVEGLTRRPTYAATVVAVERVQRANGRWYPATGRVHLLVRADSSRRRRPHYGDVVLVTGAPRLLAQPANPAQFDYARYMRYRQTWHEQFVAADGLAIYGYRPPNPLVGWSLHMSEVLSGVLKEHVRAPREAGLVRALVLGVTDDLAAELKSTYSTTGTAHVLAVSGLHIGLVFTLVIGMLGGKRWRYAGWRRRMLTLAVILVVIWGYALLTGLSASVLRAVVMGMLVAIGQALNKRVNLYNTLAIAAFMLLVYAPYTLFDVGFQLSFSAVLGIAYLQPRLARHWQPTGRIWRLLRDSLAVTLAAQMATVPLTLYYFHQFPVHFILANLLAVPWSNGMLYTAFGLLASVGFAQVARVIYLDSVAGGLDMLSAGIGRVLEWLTYWLNETMVAIGRLPAAVISGIDLTALQLVLLYLIMLLILVWLESHVRRWLVAAVLLVALYVGTRLQAMQYYAADRTLVVYAVRHHSAVGLLNGTTATLLTDSAVWADSVMGINGVRANVLPHLWQRGTQVQRWWPLLARDSTDLQTSGLLVRSLPDGNRLLAWQGLRLLLLDYPLAIRPRADARPLSVDYVLVRGRIHIRPSVLARAVACRLIIFDGSGPAGWVRWQARQLQMAGFRCHDVGTSGALVRRAAAQ